MKKLCLLVVAAASSVVMVRGDMVILQQSPGFSAGNGGEFAAYSSSGDLYNAYGKYYADVAKNQGGYSGSLQVFCTSLVDTFYPGNSYNYTIGKSSLVSEGAGWLYSTFAKDTWVSAGAATTYNYNTGSDRVSSAGNLQLALWFCQGLISLNQAQAGGVEGINGSATGFLDDAVTALNLSAGDYTGLQTFSGPKFGVSELIMIGGQEQLILVPEPTTMIAGALLLLPFGASTLRILRRRTA
jgi:hypothetical protein